MLRIVPLSIIRSFSLYTQQWYMSYRFANSLRAGDALISQIYFWNKTLHVSDSSSAHHREFFTVHTAMVYVIQVCWQLASSKLSAWHIPLLCVQWKTPNDGQRNCPKHVEFYSKNKFEKLVHLVGFIIRIFVEVSTNIFDKYPSSASCTDGCRYSDRQTCKLICPSHFLCERA